MLPCLAFATKIKNGYVIEGLETPNQVSSFLPAMTLAGNPILLAPNAYALVQKIESRTSEIVGLWIEKLANVRDEIMKEVEVVVHSESPDKIEVAAHMFAMSELSNEAWLEIFRDFSITATSMHRCGYMVYKTLEQETLATDGWKPGPQAGPVTSAIREQVEKLTGIKLSDNDIKESLDKDCGDENCPVHGKNNDQTPNRADGLTDEEWKDTGLNNGTKFKETEDGIVVTHEQTAGRHQRTPNRDRCEVQ